MAGVWQCTTGHPKQRRTRSSLRFVMAVEGPWRSRPIWREDEEAEGLLSLAAERLGPLHCLINSASVFERDSLGDVTCRSWHLHMAVNVRAPLLLTQRFLQQLPQGEEGNVINIIDERVWNLTPAFPLVHAEQVCPLDPDSCPGPRARADRSASRRSGRVPTLPSVHQTASRASHGCAQPCRCGAALRPKKSARLMRFILGAPAMTGQMIVLMAASIWAGCCRIRTTRWPPS